MSRRTCLLAMACLIAIAVVTTVRTAQSSCTTVECDETSCFRSGANTCKEYDRTVGKWIFSTAAVGGMLRGTSATVKFRIGSACDDECPAAPWGNMHAASGCGVEGTWSPWGLPQTFTECHDDGS